MNLIVEKSWVIDIWKPSYEQVLALDEREGVIDISTRPKYEDILIYLDNLKRGCVELFHTF